MPTIERVEEVLYPSGNGGEPLIGFNFHYNDGVVYPIGPILIRSELDALIKSYKND